MKNFVKISILLVLILTSIFAVGTNVDPAKAKAVASNFLKNVDSQSSELSLVYTKENAYYVFGNAKGFVIVSAEDRVSPILGYSTEGPWKDPKTFSDSSIANNFWSMMDSYEAQIKDMRLKSASIDPAISAKWQALENAQMLKSGIIPIKPLLTTKWDQGWPYNALCPADPSGPGGHVQIGCVGVAMAQIMKYHNYPEKGLGKMGYKHSSYPYTEADFGATTYKWSDMPDSITQVNNSIATLMYHCAVSVVSNWGPGETSAISGIGEDDVVARNLIKNFKYAYSSMRSLASWNYTSLQWDSILHVELTGKRPMYYSGSGTSGHSFVCDGVDENNLYHFNFGWGGLYNGYFALSAINPAGRNYSKDQIAIIGIKPNDGSTIAEHTTWKGNMTISTDVVVAEDIMLTVEAGSEIKFAKNCRLTVWGNVLSVGNKDNNIKFTSLDTLNRWNGIRFLLYNTKENISKFVYTQIEYSKNHGVLINGFGGGHGEIIFDYCKINNNHGGGPKPDGTYYYRNGGGIFAYSLSASKITITNSEIYNNKSDEVGGGIFIEKGSDIKIINNKIWGNLATIAGGVGFIKTQIFFNKNFVYNNNARNTGGIYVFQSQNIIQNNKICNNTSTVYGPGALRIQEDKSILVNNLIANNTSNGTEVLQIQNSDSLYIINNSIINNIGTYVNSIRGKNNIIYGNVGDIQSSPDPLFVKPSAGAGAQYDGLSADWSLRPESPCINAGDTTGISHLLPTTDLAGNPRIRGKIDMGAYESLNTNSSLYLKGSENSLTIYPNPCKEAFTIQTEKNMSEIRLYDMLGKIIYQKKVYGQNFTVDSSHFIPGMYLVHVYVNKDIFIRKLLVQ